MTSILFRVMPICACALAFAASPALAWPDPAGFDARPSAPAFVLIDTPVEDMPSEMALAYIRDLQEELAKHGYDAGPADGVVGGRTARAIRAYQHDAGLSVTGRATRELLDHLKFVEPKVYNSARASAGGGSESSARMLVLEVQKELRSRGFYQGAIDGLVGARTRDAARSFQSRAGYAVTGVIDAELLAQLKSAESDIRASY